MKSKLLKIIVTIFITLLIFNIFTANTKVSLALSDVTVNPDIWLSGGSGVGEGALNQKTRPILSIIRTVGVTASVVTLAIIALKIMFSSVEEKASYKQVLVPWMIGAFLVFSMSTLPSVIYKFMQGDEVNGELVVSEERRLLDTRYLCINGNEMTSRYSSFMIYTCTVEDCGCNNQRDTSTRYLCTLCYNNKSKYVILSKIKNKLYCPDCGTLYNE